jgi:hypothetical protein
MKNAIVEQKLQLCQRAGTPSSSSQLEGVKGLSPTLTQPPTSTSSESLSTYTSVTPSAAVKSAAGRLLLPAESALVISLLCALVRSI